MIGVNYSFHDTHSGMLKMILRKLPEIVVLISLLGIAFISGYLTYPYLNRAAHGAEPIVEMPTPIPTFVTPLVQSDLAVYWEVTRILDKDFYGQKPADRDRIYASIHGLVNSFNDPYTSFIEPQPRQRELEMLRGHFGGIGSYLEGTELGFFLRPMREQPAQKAGLQHCDLLLEIDGERLGPDMTAEDISNQIRGPVGEDVTLAIRRVQGVDSGTQNYDNVQLCLPDDILQSATVDLKFVIERAEIEVPSVEWHVLKPNEFPEDVTKDITEAVKIGYMRHRLFSERSTAEMITALGEMTQEGADRFIWDLRGNPGGIVNIAIELVDLWLDGGVIMKEDNARGETRELSATPGGMGVDYELVLLVDGASASASEIVAGALQDHGRSLLVGEPTYGKGSVQLIHELSDGSSLHVTNAQWLTPDGQQISQQKLQPDILTEPGINPLPEAIRLLANN